MGTALVLLSMTAFSLLLFFLTNWRPREPHRASERGMIRQVTTGQFMRDAEMIEKGGNSAEDEPQAP
ncbi:MAG: hypothetical protein ACKO0M_06480 [Cyanobium sp.]